MPSTAWPCRPARILLSRGPLTRRCVSGALALALVSTASWNLCESPPPWVSRDRHGCHSLLFPSASLTPSYVCAPQPPGGNQAGAQPLSRPPWPGAPRSSDFCLFRALRRAPTSREQATLNSACPPPHPHPNSRSTFASPRRTRGRQSSTTLAPPPTGRRAHPTCARRAPRERTSP